jgi:hypothetical protein
MNHFPITQGREPLAATGLRGAFYLVDATRAGLGHAREFAEDTIAEARAPGSPAAAPYDPAPSVVRP